jgi:squalene synthase HpnC
MSGAEPDLASGKGHRDENFPVASFIIKPRHRAAVMAFYRFARKADDIADHPHEAATIKLVLLDRMRATLEGESDADAEALALRTAQAARGLSPQHGLDLLEAFRRDVTKTRYADWADLMDYCRYSAMPVGRFVLDVHGEDPALWPANDALCAALQVINHLQDCAKDYAALDRVYIPEDAFVAAGCQATALAAPRASPALASAIRTLAHKTAALLDQSRPFARGIRDARLAYEVAAIQRLAEDLNEKLMRCDPLSERVHHTKLETARLLALAAKDRLMGRRAA